jgi:hypothetical protein
VDEIPKSASPILSGNIIVTLLQGGTNKVSLSAFLKDELSKTENSNRQIGKLVNLL